MRNECLHTESDTRDKDIHRGYSLDTDVYTEQKKKKWTISLDGWEAGIRLNRIFADKMTEYGGKSALSIYSLLIYHP